VGSSGGASGTCGTSTLGGFSGALALPKNGRSFDSGECESGQAPACRQSKLFLGNHSIAYPLAGTITAALLWPGGV